MELSLDVSNILRDNVAHVSDSNINEMKVMTVMKNITLELTRLFDNVTIFPVIGNHDVWPNGQVPVSSHDPYYALVLNGTGWEELLNADQVTDFEQDALLIIIIKISINYICLVYIVAQIIHFWFEHGFALNHQLCDPYQWDLSFI